MTSIIAREVIRVGLLCMCTQTRTICLAIDHFRSRFGNPAQGDTYAISGQMTMFASYQKLCNYLSIIAIADHQHQRHQYCFDVVCIS